MIIYGHFLKSTDSVLFELRRYLTQRIISCYTHKMAKKRKHDGRFLSRHQHMSTSTFTRCDGQRSQAIARYDLAAGFVDSCGQATATELLCVCVCVWSIIIQIQWRQMALTHSHTSAGRLASRKSPMILSHHRPAPPRRRGGN